MTITVYYYDAPLEVYPSVAKRLKLQDGQLLTSASQLIELISQSATHYALVQLATQRQQN